ncbi:AAA family ATPase [Aeromicrobium fastidiosum]|uniref:Nuclease SbcCD subunit C n=1 Tax=Aeromicrobium fastidiosum TaxID=52699 RepID=A0A641AL28_9ACTN|nr:SMC family ATPase [Aeromicrobium fastidiosum]KAA1376083.1 SMC family ATPase [Aeromicrobium fastidiosum]MBP2392041.1 exonuclease SbcC [Aeromicrobium fastidiosum]
MKIHQVTMTGFGPYRDTETVDFDAFDDDGIFLITGRTGAGKTSILDAVTYALFGSIPRYEGGAGEKVRSDHIGPTDPCRVTVDLSTADGRFRVTRSPAYLRPKQRGTGTTTAPPTFELARLVGDAWEVVESKTGNAEVRIEEIVRLSAKQFQQVILLAQGQFQEFLVATSDKRRELLRMLFDTRRFADYSEALDARARLLGDRLAASSTAVTTYSTSLAGETQHELPDTVDTATGDGVEEWVDAIAHQHLDVLEQAVSRREAAGTVLEAARAAFDAARTTRERQDRRGQVLRRQADLELVRPEIDELRLRLGEARRAAQVWPRIEAAREARRAHDDAQHRHRAADEAFRRLMPDEATDPESLAASVQQWSELLGSLRDSADRERSLVGLADAVRAATAALTTFDEQVELDARARVYLRAERETLTTTLPALDERAAVLRDVEQTVATLRTRLAAAEAADRTAVEIDEARQRQLDAGREVTQASLRRDDLRARQRAGFAGVLAQGLEPDEPCPVCGSAAHPAPAVLAEGHVDDGDVEQAEADYVAAVRRSQKRDGEVEALNQRIVAEREAAGDETSVALQAMVDGAEAAVADATTAVAERALAQQTLDRLAADIDAASERIDSAQQRRTALVAAQAGAAATHDDAVRSLETARGDHDSVADRLAAVTSHVRAGRALLETTATLTESAEHVDAARQLLAAALVEHELADAAAAEAARLPPREQTALETRIADHDAETHSVASILASGDLHDLPADLVELDGPHDAFTAADAADKEALAAESTARQKQSTVDRLATQIREALSAAGALRDEHAVVHRLASTVRGQTPNTMKMALETFALAAELEEIVRAANARLVHMTGGRYEFLHSDALAGRGAQSGLALDVLDAFTGETRPPQSLSGGEKFQASLALALGLAEVLTNRAGGIRLDTLFIDEGFGSLDADTLETTMATLDDLREGGRTIGLISHVEAMKESIPAQLFVDRTDGGWSTIRTSRPA